MKEKKTEKMLNYANGPSLEEINNTVEVPKNASFWRTLLAYSGPGALVAVGYGSRKLDYVNCWRSGI
jgi:manganese transport protein